MRFLLLAFFFLNISAFTNPTSPTVIEGRALFSEIDSKTLQIQTDDKTIINWEAFSINENECTKFIQANSDATVLNRVIGKSLSSLLGMLESNGHVLLINPNGLIIGENASIDTGSFTASTLDVLNEDFLKGKELLLKGESEKAVINLGKVEARSGNIILAAFQVENQGELISKKGTCGIGASNEVLLIPEKDEKIVIKSQINAPGADFGIQSTGTIEALECELKTFGNPYEHAIEHSGEIRAQGLLEKEGRILLVAEKGDAYINGSLSCKNANDTGGDIHILGEKIAIFDEAVIDASGKYGGGEILIGGDKGGNNPDIKNAEYVFVGEGVKVSSRAIEKGSAGKVIFWSDNYTQMYAEVDARGGDFSGDGGFIEVSGGKSFNYGGVTKRGAPFGLPGELLLDPQSDITISAAASSGGSFMGAPSSWIPTAATSNVDNTALDTELMSGPVTINTNSGVGGGPFGGRITWTGFMSNTAGTRLTLIAGEDVRFGSGTTGADVFSSAIDITAARDVVFTGDTADAELGTSSTLVSNMNVGRDLVMFSTGASGCTEFNNFYGNITVGRDCIITNNGTGGSEFDVIGDLMIGRNFTITGSGSLSATVGSDFAFSGSSMIQIGGNFTITQTSDSVFFILSTDNPVLIGGNLSVSGTDPADMVFGMIPPSPFIPQELRANNISFDSALLFLSQGKSPPQSTVHIYSENSMSFVNGSFISLGNFDSDNPQSIFFITDNAFATPPALGPGSFTLDSMSIVDKFFPGFMGEIFFRIYTSRRSQNTIDGVFFGMPFVEGPFNVDSANEIWSTYFPSTAGTGVPVTVFYKEPQMFPQIVQQSITAQVEMLRNFLSFDELIPFFENFDSDMFIGNVNGEPIDSIPFYMRLRNYGMNMPRQVGQILPY